MQINRGVLQGDPLSPFLFNLVLDCCLRQLPQGVGYRVGGGSIGHLAFADDVTLFASTPEGLSEALGAFRRALRSVGLDVNPGKCRTLALVADAKRGKVKLDDTVRLDFTV